MTTAVHTVHGDPGSYVDEATAKAERSARERQARANRLAYRAALRTEREVVSQRLADWRRQLETCIEASPTEPIAAAQHGLDTAQLRIKVTHVEHRLASIDDAIRTTR